MSEKLKPCPFCGGEAKEFTGEDAAPHRWTVECDVCGARVGSDTRHKAHAKWNRRAERTCRMEYNERWSHDEYYPTECYNCSECGHMTCDGVPIFCPNCGARVTKEASDDADR